MTFHDQVHAETETAAWKGARDLLLWLRTIGPDHPLLAGAIIHLAEEMNWPVVNDKYIGKILK